MRKLLDGIHAKCEPIRTYRDKRVAHLDLTTALRASPISPAHRQEIDDVLADIREYMNTILRHYDVDGTTRGYEYWQVTGDGEALVWKLKEALRYEDLIWIEKVLKPGDFTKVGPKDA
jgi:hypothetical protein